MKNVDNFTYKKWVGQFVTLTARSKVKTFLRDTMSDKSCWKNGITRMHDEKRYILLRTANGSKIWKEMISHVLEGHGMQKIILI